MYKKDIKKPAKQDDKIIDLSKVSRFSPPIKRQLIKEIGNRLKCPNCGTSVILTATGITCQSVSCDSKVMSPEKVLGRRPEGFGQWSMWLLFKLYPELESHSTADAKAENRLSAKPWNSRNRTPKSPARICGRERRRREKGN